MFRVRGTPRYRGFWSRCESGAWEPETFTVLENLLRPGGYFVDAGAWIGSVSLFAAALGSRVLAFEPDPVSLAELRCNIALNPGLSRLIRVQPAALSSGTGLVEMFGRTPGGSGTTLATVVFRGGRAVDLAPVATCGALDALAAATKYEFGRADVIKIDVEGSEYEILPRLAPYLERHQPPILLSLHPQNIADGTRTRRTLRVLSALHRYKPYVAGERLTETSVQEIVRTDTAVDRDQRIYLFLSSSQVRG